MKDIINNEGKFERIPVEGIEFVEDDFCLQNRVCRITGKVVKEMASVSDALAYCRLIREGWYYEVFISKGIKVDLVDLKIDLIPDNRILGVYKTYAYYLNIENTVDNSTEARLELTRLQEEFKSCKGKTLVNIINKLFKVS